MTGPASRRGFLRGLTTLPLVGGGVTLIGAPTAVAEPVTEALLDTYAEWLQVELRALMAERFPSSTADQRAIPSNTPAVLFHYPVPSASWPDVPSPSTRAALVLSAVGCNWREGGR